jgi:RNA polymerase sigma factor (sigma-70 family)
MSEPANTFATDVCASLEKLRGLARHFTRSESDADDLIQDTCVRALTYANSFKEGSNLDAWLTTIMRRHACTTATSHHRRLIPVDPVDMDRQRSTHDDIETELDERQERSKQLALLRHGISRLPDVFRSTTEQVLRGRTHAEIADELGTGKNTIDVRAHRARARLRVLVRDAAA